jgi:adenosine kinase
MTIFISGSMAIDTVLSCPFPFGLEAEHVAKQRLAVAFYMPEMRHVWGGCAGNIAYAVHQLGSNPLIMASMGHDAKEYLHYLQDLGIATDYIICLPEHLTAKAVIMNDSLGQQITGFHPGAMNEAHRQTATLALHTHQPRWAIVSPDGKQAMLNRCIELAAANVNFIVDLGQATPIFTKEEVLTMLQGARALAVNEHEALILETTLGQTMQQLSQILPVLVTLGDQGLCWWENSVAQRLAGIQGMIAVDPTGCGDSLRGAWLYGLTQGWSALDSLRLGNLMGAYKVQHAGAQGYTVSIKVLQTLWQQHYDCDFPMSVI